MNNGHQNYANHRRMHPLFHFVLQCAGAEFSDFITSIQSSLGQCDPGQMCCPLAIFLLISIILVIVFLLVRSYPLKAQDRAIRAEENLRHFVLTQKLLDAKLTIGQIAASTLCFR